ncbi:MAG: NAD(P)/FAD-dependent oxidoreductase [Hyphomonadaceae bacterium]
MPFDAAARPSPRKIAVIGAGISGLGAAHLLAGAHDVTIFEAENRLGGHARTLVLEDGLAVDTGFIVFNPLTYPRLCALFHDLDVPIKKTSMSFSATIAERGVEYGAHSLNALFAHWRNVSDPSFIAMALDILRFNQIASLPGEDRAISLGDWLDLHRFSRGFRDYYLLALAGAVWSAPPRRMLDFPAEALLAFFRNHRLISLKDRPQWQTVEGGSREYVHRLESALRARGVAIKTSARVRRITREDGVRIEIEGAGAERFDAVFLACHADQALRLLARPTRDEAKTLAALRYSRARVLLHRDARQMPRRRACWSSWNVRTSRGDASVTYWMNNLQGLPAHTPLFVTLNPMEPIPESALINEAQFAHPIFDRAAIEAQSRLAALQGVHDTYFCGAYAHYGFHEDGLRSAMEAVDAFARAPAPQ